ncbi:HIT family hydrolase [candidate division KSB1 bacterium 4484_87]|nr:MAG: HIT family hydrolase [candidate division KSB1 bacterium 4484_87]
MEKLWAPWRIEYIEMPKEDNSECIFCDKPSQNEDEKNLILYRGKTCFVIFNRYPYNNGHLMVVPFKHTNDLNALTDEEKLELMDLLIVSQRALSEIMAPQGFNIGMNLGQVAGAGVKDHLHFHIVPRWNGDTNFMPVLGETKVISEGLEQTYRKLKPVFEKLVSGKK